MEGVNRRIGARQGLHSNIRSKTTVISRSRQYLEIKLKCFVVFHSSFSVKRRRRVRTLRPLGWPAIWSGTRPTPSEPPGSRSVNAGSRTPFRQTDRHPGRSTAVGGRVSPLPRQRRRVATVSHRTVGPRPLPSIRIPDWGRRSAGNSATRGRRSSHVPPGTGRNPAAP